MVNALRLVKKQWFIVNHSENSQRFMVTLYFWKSTTTPQFLSVLWDRNCRRGWEQNMTPDLFYRILGSVLHMVSCADSRSDLTVGRTVGMNCALVSDGLSHAQAWHSWVELDLIFCIVMAEFWSPSLTQLLFTKHTHFTCAYSRKILISLCIRNIVSNFLSKTCHFTLPPVIFHS